jgi:peptide/nickel transport system substrate-binding protein
MKRLFVFVLLLVLIGSVFGVPMAQDMAPEGTFLGTWPYSLPPNHHFNAFADGGPDSNLGLQYKEMVLLAPAFYIWSSNNYQALLAESWGFTEDGSAYEFTLRSDALWSNGDPITSNDVVMTYALGRLKGWSQFNYYSKVEAVDDHTVRFTFSDQPSLLAERLILRESILPASVYGDFAQRALDLFATGATSDSEEWTALLTELGEFRPEGLVASGPYTYTLADVGDSFFTMHWQPNSIFSGSVKFGEIKLWAGETDATTPLVLSGEIAHATNVYPPATLETFQNEGLRIIKISRGYGPVMLFNFARAPWNIVEVRQAVALVIERSQNAFLTNGLAAAGTVYMSGILDDNVAAMLPQDVIDQLDHYDFDTARAEALLGGVGFARNDAGIWENGDGVTLSGEWLIPADFADFAGASQDAIAQLNAFGFDLVARAVPWQEVPPAIRAGEFEVSVWSWGAASPFAYSHLRNPLQRWTTELDTATQPGLNIPMSEYPYNGGTVNLDDMIIHVNDGIDLETHRQNAGEIALIINQTMPFIPLNIMQSAEPFNTSFLSGLPEDGDPILLNPAGADHFMKLYILTGMVGPA